MKTRLAIAVVLLLFICGWMIYHPVVLNWAPSPNLGPSGFYKIYRARSACPTSGWPENPVLLASTPNVTYTDRSIKFGTFCYVVTATINGRESPPSNTSQVHIVPTWRH